MNEMVMQVAAVCRQHPIDEKLLFVPSYSIGHQIREHLAKSGTPWINLRVTTAVGYAPELTALDLSAGGNRLITPRNVSSLLRPCTRVAIYRWETTGILEGLKRCPAYSNASAMRSMR